MRITFDAAIEFALQPENDGQPYHVDAHDPGGGTAWGVTEATWATALAHGYVAGELLADATQAQCVAILRAMYWNACCCDNLPRGVDAAVFDMAMVAGPGRAVRLLQRVVGTVEDASIGPKTMLAVADAKPRDIVMKLTTADEAFFASLNTFCYFGRGWDRRAEDCQRLALSLLVGVSP